MVSTRPFKVTNEEEEEEEEERLHPSLLDPSIPTSEVEQRKLSSVSHSLDPIQTREVHGRKGSISCEGSPLIPPRPPITRMSAIKICGLPLNIGADDLWAPAAWSSVFNLAFLGVTALAYVYIGDEDTCETDGTSKANLYRTFFLAAYSSIAVIDFFLLFFSIRTKLFVPNPTAVFLFYLRLLSALFMLVAVVCGTIWFGDLNDDCFHETHNEKIYDLNLAILIVSWVSFVHTLFMLWFFFNSFNSSSASENWRARIRFWTCACLWDNQHAKEAAPNMMDEISENISALFSVEGMVPSDIATGSALVKALQKIEVKRGLKSFHISATTNPGFGEGAGDDADMERKENEDGNTAEDTGNNSNPIEDEDINIMLGGPSSSSPKGAHDLESGHKESSGDLAQRGIQPALPMSDWKRLDEARYYSKFMFAAYGWPLQSLVKPSDMLTCKFCHCCMDIPGSTIYTGQSCCNGSLHQFIRKTGIAREDLLSANLESKVGKIVHYVCVDRKSKSIVICCRGTLSVDDVMTDLDTEKEPLDKYGYEGHYAHRGILRGAVHTWQTIKNNAQVDTFLKANPEFRIRIVGHSLGAGTATVLGLLMAKEYPRLHVISYASPLVIDKELANKPSVGRFITTIVYAHDVVCRLSVNNMYLLKHQMQLCFGHAVEDTKYRIMKQFKAGDYEGMLDLPPNMDFSSTDPSKGYFQLADAVQSGAADGDAKKLQEGAQSINRTDEALFGKWKNFYMGGRVLHIARVRVPKKDRGCIPGLCEPPPLLSVYPSDSKSFEEIVIDSSMLLDHMPYHYMDKWDMLEWPADFRPILPHD